MTETVRITAPLYMRKLDHPLLTELLISLSLERDAVMTDGAALARILLKLAEHEIETGGPYAATPGGGIEDADLGLNLAAAVYLGMHDVRLPNLDAFIDARLASGTPTSALLDQETLDGLIARDRELRESAVYAAPADTKLQYDAHEASILEAIRRAARDRFRNLPDAFTENALAVIERTMRGNPDKQMSLMPLFMRDALGAKGEQLTDERLADFGLANVFFWTAFIIYDDFWDEDEAAEPKLLPVANLFARHYTQFFGSAFPPDAGFTTFFHDLMDKLDTANEWEMLSCRLVRKGNVVVLPDALPEYGDFMIKFHPAAGHVLGPVAMLVELGYALDSNEVSALIEYFKQYLVAMQLNDDAHDWKEDLARGHISTAVALLLAVWKGRYPDRPAIDLESDMPELERLFWFYVLTPLCESVLACTKRSREALQSLDFIENAAPLERFIMQNERIAQEALDEQKRSVAFLETLKT